MKLKRQKRVAKILKYFQLNFGFRKPWNLVIDGTLCVACLDNKVNLRDQMPKYLDEVKMITTGCCITEMETIGSHQLFGATQILKNLPLFRCGHKKAVSGRSCIKELVGDGNQHHLMIASQDDNLRNELRQIPGIPLLYLHGCAPTLEKPSYMTEKLTNRFSDGKTDLSSHQKMIIKELKKKTFGEQPEDESTKKKKKKFGRKQPNPLSCLKKKKKIIDDKPVSQPKKKRRRKGKKETENLET